LGLIKKYGWNISQVSDRLKNSKNFIRKIVKFGQEFVFSYADEALKNDEQFIEELVKINKNVLTNLSEEKKKKYGYYD
jgi:Domain of unknown function (DUF4116)